MAKKKSPGLAAVLSFLIPGLGQIYSGEVKTGVGFIIIAIIFASLLLFLIHEQQSHMRESILVTSGAYILLVVRNMYDAYETAKGVNSKV